MENELKNTLIKKAQKFCEENVHDWHSMDEDKKLWYLKKVSRLLLDDKDVLKEIFKIQLN